MCWLRPKVQVQELGGRREPYSIFVPIEQIISSRNKTSQLIIFEARTGNLEGLCLALF